MKVNAKIYRLALNLWPCISGSGGKITYISPDYRELDVKLPLNWRTRNAVGTIFGGSMYASTDPFFMLMFIQILGPEFVVWDKGCTIRFKKPAKKTLFAKFLITDEMLSDVKTKVEQAGKGSFTWTIEYKDKDGVVYAEFDKVIYIAKKSVYEERLKEKNKQAT